MEYVLTDSEKAFVQTLKSQLTIAKANVREAQAALAKAEEEEKAMIATFDGAVKLLLNAHQMQQATLSADCGKIVSK